MKQGECAAGHSAGDPGLVGLFEEQVRRRPEAIAVSCGEAQLSYAELDRRANCVARHLLALGAKRETLVGLCMTRSAELIVGMLGIVKAGAAYLPLDLVYPGERLAFMLEDAEAPLLLTLSGDRDALPATSARIVCLDTDVDYRGVGDATPGIDHSLDALAYVIYTSGSTGTPKGCQLTHRNVVRLFSSTDPWFGFNERDVWSCFHSHAFDFSVWEIWGALLYGGRVVVVPYAVTRSPGAFRQLLIDEGVTILNQTPSAFLQLMRADEAAGERGDFALREVIFGGEALELQTLAPWLERYGDSRPRLVNMYGITETTVHVSYRPIVRADLDRGLGSVIGVPIPDLSLYVLDDQLRRVAPGTEGELFVGGAGVARGYLKRPELNAERFIEWRAPGREDAPVERLYRSGDLARMTLDGDLEYLGRIDTQVKIRGFRIETGEIEAALTKHPQVRACAVVAREDRPGDKRLVAYVLSDQSPLAQELREHLAATLPEYMLPSAFVAVDSLPLTANGKLDRRALPAPGSDRPELACAYEPPATPAEKVLCEAFAAVLGIDRVGRHDNFFELGGNSMLATSLLEQVRGIGAVASAGDITVITLFRHPTPAGLTAAIGCRSAVAVEPGRLPRAARVGDCHGESTAHEPIAIVAMAGRFPGAGDVEAFWSNLCEGRDSITKFRPEDLDPAVSAADRASLSYVMARGVVDGVEQFDAAFFGVGQREAELMDPQQRIFLELCWECMERAGHVPDAAPGPVGVFAGMFNASYFQRHVCAHPDLVEKVGEFQVMLNNEKDFIATHVAHKLNLTGPAISIHTACSTSLVAICQATDSLRAGQCDMALAGGISITCPPRSGYFYQEGAMLSPDGHTRSFDAGAQGTVFSDGAAVVLLKRLSDALADGNEVIAVVRGGAINNDGGGKASFSAPSSEGQAAVIAMAHDRSGVKPRSIGYVEAHGTATPVGDPIEIEGLTKAFRQGTEEVGFCRIGSVKSNVGHLVIAAGAAGVIKTALALKHNRIPASLHFTAPNPAIGFAGSPFVVNAELSEWPSDGAPRRAGVSSFGVGGTNAHVVMEQAPDLPESQPASGPQLLVLSARTPTALALAVDRLAEHLDARAGTNLADVAWTLATGRKAFAHRVAIAASDVASAIDDLRGPEVAAAVARSRPAFAGELVFMFPGQGATYAGMGRSLYDNEPVFRAAFDDCAEALRGELARDLRELVFADDAEALVPTGIMQPATFAIEYALAQWWMSHGVIPAAMIGHSVGEFVAATLAGVFALPDAVRLVARRGALMQAQPAGAMMSVRLGIDALRERLPVDVSVAAENAPGTSVVAGRVTAIAQFQSRLESDGVPCRVLRTSHAFHSPMMDPVVAPFLAEVAALELAAPRLPLVSTATGDWLDATTAVSPQYWARHLREPVRFSAALGRVLDAPTRVLLEVGPRATLSALARQHPRLKQHAIAAVATLSDASSSESTSLRLAVGNLWCRGVPVDPSMFDRRGARRRLRLPTYPFERKRFWVEASPAGLSTLDAQESPVAVTTVDDTLSPQGVLSVEGGPIAACLAEIASAPSRRPRLMAALKDVFRDIVGFEIADTDIATNFMELGVDSLMLTQVALQLQKSFGVRITFRQLMGECATLGRLAELLDDQLESAAVLPPPVEPIRPVSDAVSIAGAHAGIAAVGDQARMRQVLEQQIQLLSAQLTALAASDEEAMAPSSDVAAACAPESPAMMVLPVLASGGALQLSKDEAVDRESGITGRVAQVVPTTEPQQEIWLADQIGREASLAFNLSVSLLFRGRLDVEALQEAMRELVDRHDALRSSVGSDGLTLHTRGQLEVPLQTLDLSGLGDEAREDMIGQRLRDSVETPFALDVGPLFRAELLRLAEDRHLLLMTAHHIACDGWSWWLIVRELGALYALRCGIAHDPLPKAVSFAQYALSQADRQASEAQAGDEAYWLSRFSGDVPVLDLPTDRPRPVHRSFASAREDHIFDAALLADLRRMGARRGASLFSTLLAGFAGLLSRLSDQLDVVVAIPAAGQPVDGHDNLVGHCVNLLPLRFEVDPARPFAWAIDAAQATLLDALEHQRYTFGTLLKKLRIRRDPSRMPLVSVLFNLDQALDRESGTFPGLAMEFESNPRSFETFELFVNAVQVHGELRLECQYNTDLFDAATVRQWLHAFEALMRAAVERQTTHFGGLPLIDAAAQVELAALQPEPVSYDRDCRMHEYFEAQCDRTPDRIAVRFGREACSYVRLEVRANRIAHLLRESGVQRGSLVGIAMDRNVDIVAAVLGVLKAGAGYVPLDPDYPQSRLAYMAADAGLAALLTTARHASRFDPDLCPVHMLDQLTNELAGAPCTRIGRDAEAALAEGVAYVIYTSGSTGRPKGVQVPHRAVANFVGSMQREPGLTADDRFLAVTTLSFDISVLELMLPLSVGAEVILADRATAGDGAALVALMNSSGVTAMQGTPSTWRMLLDAGWKGQRGFKALCGGEALAPDLAAQLLPLCGCLWNLYGPTETTVWSTCARIVAPARGSTPDINIGRPIANTRVWVLDSGGLLCPPGVPGEIHIGGEGVSRGYLGRPELTAERFIPDRHAPMDEGAGEVPLMYRTGDRGRWRPDGCLEHLGRLDHQIKVRGYRIELGEIEANLTAQADIARALVIVREDKPSDQRIVAYVIVVPGARWNEEATRAHLRELLPAYMVPQHFVHLHELPLLPNGKIDRAALPRPSAQRETNEASAGAEAGNSALDPRVQYLADIWSELLGTAAGPDDNFFDLGGHSMLAVQMANRVARDTGVRIKLIRLGAQTLCQVAAGLPRTAPVGAATTGVRGRISSRLRRLLGQAFTSLL